MTDYVMVPKALIERAIGLFNAVGHVGVDFGQGEYMLCNDEIEEARVLYHELGTADSAKPVSAEPVAILCRQTDESKTEWFDHDPLMPGSTRHKIRANHGGWDLLPVYASPPKQEWIKCSERMPDVNKDFDWEGNIWVCSPLGAVFSVCGISDLSDGWWWMPTGLTKPQPPQE